MAKTFLQLYTDGLQQADEVSGVSSKVAKEIIKTGINESYAEVAGIRDWKTLENSTTVSTVASTEEYTPVTSSSSVCRIRRIESIVDQTNKKYLMEMKREIFEQQYPYPSLDTGTPTIYYMSGYDSNRNMKFKLYKVPDSTLTLKVVFYEEPLELVNDNDIPRIPDQFHYGLVYLGLAKYFEYQKDPMSNYYRGLHEDFKRKILTIEYGESDNMPEMTANKQKYGGFVTGKIGRIYN